MFGDQHCAGLQVHCAGVKLEARFRLPKLDLVGAVVVVLLIIIVLGCIICRYSAAFSSSGS